MLRNATPRKTLKGDAELVLALASGATVTEAAERAGIHPSTAFRRLQNPAYQAEVASTRTMLISQSVGLLAASGAEAAQTLRNLLNDSEPAHVRLGAAKSILELVPRLRESEELANRIAALEQQLDQMPQTGDHRWRA